MKHPHEGGRYIRQKDGSLKRADEPESVMPAADVAAERKPVTLKRTQVEK